MKSGQGREAARLERNALALAVAVLLALACLLQAALYERGKEAPERLLFFPNAKALHAYALGYENAMADLLWMRTLAYFGGHYESDKNYRYLAHMLDVITRLNPRHRRAYYMAATVLPWVAGEVDASERLLIRAMVNMPEEGEWAYRLGFVRFLFDDDRVSAAHWLARAVAHGYINQLSAALAASLQQAVGGLDAAHDFLVRSIRHTRDQRTRAYLKEQLVRVDTERILRALEAALNRLGIGHPGSVAQLRGLGLRWPDPLPDGGHVVIKDGRLYSSATMRRFSLHESRKARKLRRRRMR